MQKGSWFSYLQKAGMTVIPHGIGKAITGGIGAAAGRLAGKIKKFGIGL